MQKQVTVSALSPLGRLLALFLVSALLLLFGMYLATDGSFFKTAPTVISSTGAIARNARAATSFSLDSIAMNLKLYNRQDLLFGYGAAIFLGFLCTGLFGRLIRSYRFRFVPDRSRPDGGLVERRAMWLVMPVWLLSWLVLAFVIFCISQILRLSMVQMPLWLVLTIGVPPFLLLIAWAFNPDLMEKRYFVLRRRIPLWVFVWPGLFVLVPPVALLCRLTALPPVPVPVWLLLALIIPPMPLMLVWAFLPHVAAFCLFIPGFRCRIPFTRVKRMEVQSSGEGSTVLVLTFKNGKVWTIHGGTPKRLLRVGGVLSRGMGLERRDLMTWS